MKQRSKLTGRESRETDLTFGTAFLQIKLFTQCKIPIFWLSSTAMNIATEDVTIICQAACTIALHKHLQSVTYRNNLWILILDLCGGSLHNTQILAYSATTQTINAAVSTNLSCIGIVSVDKMQVQESLFIKSFPTETAHPSVRHLLNLIVFVQT